MRLLRMPAVMHRLGMISGPSATAEARRKVSTFHRRYRTNPNFPLPVQTPEGRLSWREDEVDAYISSLLHAEGDPRADVFVVEPGKGTPEGLERFKGTNTEEAA